ncbi:MAG: lamin tail domain-containing protein [Candidatus Woesearchaeota archaeon]|nr:lamin tail domain-containing protein [Candidatus Woesearchaeota archaeon]
MKLIFYIFLLLIPFSCALQLSEIMPYPEDGNEWIELYSKEDINITGLEITDNLNTDQIICCNDDPCDYHVSKNTTFLILDQDTSMNTSAVHFCVDDNSIGNSLGNNEDRLIFKKDNIALINFSYNLTLPKGKSYSFTDRWEISDPSPGIRNLNQQQNKPNETVPRETTSILAIIPLFEKTTTNQEQNFFKVQNMAYHDSGQETNAIFTLTIHNITTKMHESKKNISFKSYTTATGSYMFTYPGNYTICGNITTETCFNLMVEDSFSERCNVSLETSTDKSIYLKGEQIKITHNLRETYPYSIEYHAEDLFGEVIKEKATTTNNNQKSFTPTFEEDEKAIIIFSELHAQCNNSNKDTKTENLIVVKGNKSTETFLKIVKSPEEASYGETFEAELSIRKGDTRKSAVKITVNGASETTSLNVYSKEQEFSISVPIRMKECGEGGTFELVAEGLDNAVAKTIKIKEEPCNKKTKSTSSSSGSGSSFGYERVGTAAKKEYELISFTKELIDEHNSIVRISNTDASSHNYSIWSYIYDGSRSLSGEREANKKELTLNPGQSKSIELKTKVLDKTSTSPKLKIRILREDRKTPHEFTEDLSYGGSNHPTEIETEEATFESNEAFEEQQTENIEPKNKSIGNELTGEVVYDSNSKQKSIIPFLIIICITLIAIGIIKYNSQ